MKIGDDLTENCTIQLIEKTAKTYSTHQKNISPKQLYSDLSSKTVTFTKFLSQKYVRERISVSVVLFPHCTASQCGNYGNLFSSILGKNFVKVTVLLDKEITK